MEAIDAASRQSFGLPSLTNLDADRIKREDADSRRKHSMPGPLHPFSNHHSSNASAIPGPLGGLLSPPESQRTSGDEKELQRGPTRQSLPSIHEALGGPEQPLAFGAPPPGPPPSAPASVTQSYFPPPPTTTVSPADHRKRAFSSDFHTSHGPSNSFPHPRSPFISTSTSLAGPPPPSQPLSDPLSRPSFSEARPSYSEPRPSYPSPRPSFSAPQHNPKLPTLHPLRTNQSPPPDPGRPNPPYTSYPPQQSPAYESPGPHSAGPMNPNYLYAQYNTNYPHSAPAPGAPNPQYPPSTATYSAPLRPYPAAQTWLESRPEEKKISRSSLAGYGESVKRHLESFDLEASLNEMAEGAGRITDFSNEYRQRAHQNQRIGMTPQSMPRLERVDEMLKHSESIQVSLQRMREVVFNHHQASMVEPPQDARYARVNGYGHDAQSNYGDDGKGCVSFTGPDAKRPRKGRAAPPGRCHSCNRAETPEWRRGPDGARTLCNACGLHYAKLTRKIGSKQAMASSNLRPKSLDHGSPTA